MNGVKAGCALALALAGAAFLTASDGRAQSSSASFPPPPAEASPPTAPPEQPVPSPPSPATAPPSTTPPPPSAAPASVAQPGVVPPQGAQSVAPPPAPSTANIPGSCDDGVQNGPESDVDCGGDCPPCERRGRCQRASDCASGLCAANVCEERRWLPGEPVPAGYETRVAQSDSAASVRLVGSIFLGVGYSGAYVAALSYPGRIGALYVPIAGPWLTLKQTDASAAKAVLAADGAIQGAGAILLIGGIVGAGTQLVRKPPAEPPPVAIVPTVSPQRWGLLLQGRF